MAPNLINHIWNLAGSLGYSSFLWESGNPIMDDHVAFSRVTQIPSIDIIDLDYSVKKNISNLADYKNKKPRANHEWTQLFASDLFPLWRAKGKIDELTALVSKEKGIREFLKDYMSLLAA